LAVTQGAFDLKAIKLVSNPSASDVTVAKVAEAVKRKTEFFKHYFQGTLY